jgi:hypothetical protein
MSWATENSHATQEGHVGVRSAGRLPAGSAIGVSLNPKSATESATTTGISALKIAALSGACGLILIARLLGLDFPDHRRVPRAPLAFVNHMFIVTKFDITCYKKNAFR